MSFGTESQSDSQYLSSSQSSLSTTKKASSEISKTYKHASQLYLTRRLAEAYDALQPVIKPPQPSARTRHEDDGPVPAPIATASTSQRIKTWSLYAALLNATIDLGSEAGSQEFGQKQYRNILKLVQNGDVWEEVVQDGYRGREASVDAEVVYNISTLLLNKAQDQSVNQSRLERYLSSSSPSPLEISTQISDSLRNGHHSPMNGASTPKDLSSRIKIIELFTLHVLPSNNEWEYARSFVANSDVLDDERREAFLQTLFELQEVKERDSAIEDATDYSTEQDSPETDPEPPLQNGYKGHQRTSSEVDYGIESTHPNGGGHTPSQLNSDSPPSAVSSKPLTTIAPRPEPTNSAAVSRPPHLSPPAHTPRRPPQRRSKAQQQSGLTGQARALFTALSNLTRNLGGALVGNSNAVLRLLLFMLAFLVAFSRRDISERVQAILGQGWEKMRRTAGMGVKVSYI
ncbi:uncharacterized protein HMPREF1541_02320 [Cyphellophora europaea CBS 101466]|uniref:Peroxin 26 n=1 Tax=Cyphellophora europaea (strain CBS 101466) TaxID=1220924 RepID=W2S393_CYPE1|nr:uncharacterized protein HMPREF1541_02320 [Cyphellophora europaea CBS 101466]ETN43162.1 hypothetical protein HMPREF1541_02320 [Cyphellophora europaea CBS 101466]